jgi:hypothetical protein
MDRFGYSLLPAAAEAGLGTTTLCRHIPVFRRVVGRDETTLVIAPCFGPHRLLDSGLLLLLTDAHLVITQRARPLQRIRLYLHAGVTELADVRAAPRRDAVELRFRTGAEHEFLVRPGYPADVHRLAAALRGGLVPDALPVAGGTAARVGMPRPEHHSLASYWSVQPVRHAPPAEPAPVRAGLHFRRNH